MVNYDLKTLSQQELKSLQKKIEHEITSRDKRQRKEALSAVKEMARELGFSLDELVSGTSANSSGGGTAARTPAPAKYRSADNPDLTWSGRGRPPYWIKEAQEKGIDLETLLISD